MYQTRPQIINQHKALIKLKSNSLIRKRTRNHGNAHYILATLLPPPWTNLGCAPPVPDWPYQTNAGKESFLRGASSETLKRKI